MRAGCMRPWRGQCTGAGLMPGNGREGPMVDLACPPKACIQRKESWIQCVTSLSHNDLYVFIRLCSVLLSGLMNAWEWTQEPKKDEGSYSKSGRAPDCGYNASPVFLVMTFHFLWCMLLLPLGLGICEFILAVLGTIEAFYTWLFFVSHKLYTSHPLN